MLSMGIIAGLLIWSIEDIKSHLVDMRKVAMFAIAGLLLQIILKEEGLMSLVMGILAGGFVYLVSLVSREKIGKGDAFIVMTMGIYMGFSDLIKSLWLASILAAAGGLLIIALKKKNLRYEMPFVPFLLGGYLIVYSCSLFGGVL